MHRPQIDDELTLLTDFGETKAVCAEVSDDSLYPDGVLLKVMTRGPFEEYQQCWIIDPDGSKIGATVRSIEKQTIDSEVMLSAMFS